MFAQIKLAETVGEKSTEKYYQSDFRQLDRLKTVAGNREPTSGPADRRAEKQNRDQQHGADDINNSAVNAKGGIIDDTDEE